MPGCIELGANRRIAALGASLLDSQHAVVAAQDRYRTRCRRASLEVSEPEAAECVCGALTAMDHLENARIVVFRWHGVACLDLYRLDSSLIQIYRMPGGWSRRAFSFSLRDYQ